MADAFVSQPEFFEVELGESLISRTETLASFRELGPPDLCHVIKTTGRTGAKDIGSYHYVSGVDASSSAALAAYINSLTYELDQNPAWFSGKGQYKLKSGAYCCFNAFSRLDLRVEVRIPGSVDAYVVDLRGERHEATAELWQEVYLSALLRSILYSDDANYRLAGYRKLDPIASREAEMRFLRVAENLFFKGWQLGSDPEIQVATVVSNHLTNGILKYFGESFRFEQAANLFEKLYAREPEVAALVAKAYVGMNEELKAVQVMHSAIQNSPASYSILHVQADLLRSKGKTDWALKLAKQGVNSAPSEFVTWAKLTECYIERGEWEEALFTLNSCPMFTYNERDLHRMPTPARSHLPVKAFIAESNLLNEESARDNEADVALLRLPAPALRGTFAKAYSLLTRLVAQIGWDELLKCRSSVFVMEEEYRAQKSGAAENEGGRDDASTRGIAPANDGDETITSLSNDSPKTDQNENEGKDGDRELDESSGSISKDSSHDESSQDTKFASEDDSHNSDQEDETQDYGEETRDINQSLNQLGISSLASSQSIPTIKISTESDHEREKKELEEYMQGQKDGEGGEETESSKNVQVQVEAPPLEKPAIAQASSHSHARTDSNATAQATGGDTSVLNGHSLDEKINQDGSVNPNGPAPVGAATSGNGESNANTKAEDKADFSFTNKRLCERWLDNLFMVLYEDLRVYTIWRAEVAHYKAQSLPYSKTGTEWEILGELAMRLHHPEEGKDAFQRCVDKKFSAKAYLRLLEIYVDQRDVQRSLWTAIRLTAYHHRWYMEGSFPGAVAHSIFKLIRTEGLAKVSYTLVSMSPPPAILRLMQNFFAYAQTFKVPGYDF